MPAPLCRNSYPIRWIRDDKRCNSSRSPATGKPEAGASARTGRLSFSSSRKESPQVFVDVGGKHAGGIFCAVTGHSAAANLERALFDNQLVTCETGVQVQAQVTELIS